MFAIQEKKKTPPNS